MKSETRTGRWMVVDDTHEVLMMMRVALERFHGAIDCFASPQAAQAAFSAAPDAYELVITDFEMPGMDGIELCRRLRMMTPAQEIFLATGSGFVTEAEALRAGFCGLLNKPFTFDALRDALNQAGIETEAQLTA